MDKISHMTIQMTPTIWRRNVTAIANDHRVKPKLIVQDQTPDCPFFDQMIQFVKLTNHSYLISRQPSHIRGEANLKTHLVTGEYHGNDFSNFFFILLFLSLGLFLSFLCALWAKPFIGPS
jgi:hypothetical protein